ncbi:MAG: hypothetical protein COA43_00445 [Robiginitomaculum sp.]|nr:MAG: hypothetical protein COA43_00445 [Robiginitomaculum sp.]
MIKFFNILSIFLLLSCTAEIPDPKTKAASPPQNNSPENIESNVDAWTTVICEEIDSISANIDLSESSNSKILQFKIHYVDNDIGQPTITDENINWVSPTLETETQAIPENHFCYLMTEL